MKTKTISITLMLLLSIGIVVAEPLFVSKDVYVTIPDEDIAGYMIDTFTIDSYTVMQDGVHIYYNYTGVEVFNETHVGVYPMQTPTWLAYDDITFCLDLGYDINTCANFLVNHNEVIIIPIEQEDGEMVNRTITPTYVQAFNVGLTSYENAITIKNNIAKESVMNQIMDITN